MIKIIIFTLLCSVSFIINAQNITANQLLEKTMRHHDLNDDWKTFNVVMLTPNAAKRTSVISINLPKEYFSVKATRDTITTTYTLDKGKCEMRYNDKILDSIEAKEKNMTCNRATLYKNYYSYLYGLPMKLKDPGTNINDKV